MRYPKLTATRIRPMPVTALLLSTVLGGCVGYSGYPSSGYGYGYPASYPNGYGGSYPSTYGYNAGYPRTYTNSNDYRPVYTSNYNGYYNTYGN